MGAYDRDYARDLPTRTGAALPPVSKWLIILNVVIFFGDILLFNGRKSIEGGFSVAQGFQQGEVWRLLSFQFMHGSLAHVFGNCLGIYFFGPWAERWWGSARFLLFYLLCGIAGACFYTLLMLLGIVPGSVTVPLIGASAGVFGILVCVAIIAPNLRVMLYLPPVEMSIRQLALIYLGISAIVVTFTVGGNIGGEAGHLGGAILGFVLMKFPRFLGHSKTASFGSLFSRPNGTQRRGLFQKTSKLRPRTRVSFDETSEVDRILDKVHREGLQSLTAAEKKTLNDASNKNR